MESITSVGMVQKWPRSILDKSTLTREILEYAIDEPALIRMTISA